MTAWAPAAIGALVLAWLIVLCITRARRLDRLHVRMDAARAGLTRALERRRAAAGLAAGLPGGWHLGTALAAGPPDRESAENALGRALAAVDRTALPAAARHELAEAEQSVALARRVHNDAVRDTLALRSRRLVRWLHLAGTAPMPAYFEIADPVDVTGAASAAPQRSRVAPPR